MKGTKGYTLIEVLIALSIFSIISLIAIKGLHMAITSQQIIRTHQKQFNQLSYTAMMLQEDIDQIVDRPFTTPDKQRIKSIELTPSTLSLTRFGSNAPLERITYSLEKEGLMRESWALLDSPAKKTRRCIMTDIEDLSFISIKGLSKERCLDPLPAQRIQASGKASYLAIVEGQRSSDLTFPPTSLCAGKGSRKRFAINSANDADLSLPEKIDMQITLPQEKTLDLFFSLSAQPTAKPS